jgi:hypothetical protein
VRIDSPRTARIFPNFRNGRGILSDAEKFSFPFSSIFYPLNLRAKTPVKTPPLLRRR